MEALGRASKNPEIRSMQQKEADEFNPLGMRIEELMIESQITKNPILREKLLNLIASWKERSRKSREQNELSFQKLDNFKENALGMGLRKVMSMMRRLVRETGDLETEVVMTLLEATQRRNQAQDLRKEGHPAGKAGTDALRLQLEIWRQLCGRKERLLPDIHISAERSPTHMALQRVRNSTAIPLS